MADRPRDDYERAWDPRAYLRQYYASPRIPEDDRVNFAFMVEHLRRAGRRFRTAIEVGCGPTVHNAVPLLPYVEEIHLADYLPANLEEVRRRLDGDPNAHDAEVYFLGALAAEGAGASESAERKRQLRRRVTALKAVDLRHRPPLADGATYELVASSYCVECVARSRAEWADCLASLASLVVPGGVLLLRSLRRSRVYHVFDHRFATACVDEADYEQALPRLGFDPARTHILAVPIADWTEQGFDSINCVWAEKHG